MKLKEFIELSQEEKNEIIEYYMKVDNGADDMTIMQYLFFKCVWICQDTNADDLKLEADLLKINKKASLKFTFEDLKN